MIKWKGYTKNGEQSLGLGLSEKNIRYLKQGKPIFIRASELQLSFHIIIHYGKTEEEMIKELIKEGMMDMNVSIHEAEPEED